MPRYPIHSSSQYTTSASTTSTPASVASSAVTTPVAQSHATQQLPTTFPLQTPTTKKFYATEWHDGDTATPTHDLSHVSVGGLEPSTPRRASITLTHALGGSSGMESEEVRVEPPTPVSHPSHETMAVNGSGNDSPTMTRPNHAMSSATDSPLSTRSAGICSPTSPDAPLVAQVRLQPLSLDSPNDSAEPPTSDPAPPPEPTPPPSRGPSTTSMTSDTAITSPGVAATQTPAPATTPVSASTIQTTPTPTTVATTPAPQPTKPPHFSAMNHLSAGSLQAPSDDHSHFPPAPMPTSLSQPISTVSQSTATPIPASPPAVNSPSTPASTASTAGLANGQRRPRSSSHENARIGEDIAQLNINGSADPRAKEAAPSQKSKKEISEFERKIFQGLEGKHP
jgi:hypothetical protein